MVSSAQKPQPTRQDELDLVARFLRGEAEAFTELFHLHRKAIVRLVARMLGRGGDVQDVVQEVFLQVFRSLPTFHGHSRLSTWVYRIGVNVVLMHRRASRSRPRLTLEELGPAPCDRGLLPDEQVERKLRLAALEYLLDQLSERKRTVFILHELEGIPPLEIARIVRAPVLTVRTRLFYARRELAALLMRDPHLRQVLPELAAGASDPHRPASSTTPGAPIVPTRPPTPLTQAGPPAPGELNGYPGGSPRDSHGGTHR